MEHHFFEPILSYLKAHPHMGLLFTFLVAFSESLPLIGTVIPGTVTMTIVGILIGTGALPATVSIVIASLAAFAGDSIGFVFGYHYNERMRTMWPFKKHPKWLAMGEAFFKKHGGKSIIIGRFIGPARSTVPLIAGLLKLTWGRFAIAAIPSAFLWAIMYLTPGILLGAVSREIPEGETTRFFLYGLAVVAAIWLTFWLIQHFFIQLSRLINHLTDKLWNYLSKKHAGKFFIRHIENQQKPSDHHQLTLFLTACLSGLLFLILFWSVRHHGALTDANYPIFHALQSIRTTSVDKVMVIFTIMGMPTTIFMVTILTTAGLIGLKQWRSACHFFAGLIAVSGIAWIFKKTSHSLRPQGYEHLAASYSFPSGHTALSVYALSFIAFLIAQLLRKGNRWIPFVISTVFITAIGFSRLYLGAHWLTDVIGSVLLGLAVLLLCIVSYRRMPTSSHAFNITLPQAALLFTIGLILPIAINIPRSFTSSLSDYTPVLPIQTITITNWWHNPLQYTPVYRNNRLGQPFQPFNVQWQGDLARITQTLQKNGWEIIPTTSNTKLKSTFQRLTNHDAQYHIPLLNWLYHNKPPALFMIKNIPDRKSIVELRLWDSNIQFTSQKQPLWIGALDVRTAPKKLFSLKDKATMSLQGHIGLSDLKQDAKLYQRKVIVITTNSTLVDIQKLNWDGKILLIREK